jgi:hypothetical protein
MLKKVAPMDARFYLGIDALYYLLRRCRGIRQLMGTAACTFAFLLACPTQGIAQIVPIPGINFKIGDTVAVVKQALSTETEPEPVPRNSILPSNFPDANRGKTMLHLRTKGIWIFFDPAGLVEVIRLDAPFAGDVKGVRLGDDEKKLIAKLGPPISKATTLATQTYQYVLDDTAYMKFDIGADGVQRIFISK